MINLIDEPIKNILDNINLIPYVIKLICRIISELITEKFPSINLHDKNAFVAKFFFGKIIISFLSNSIIDPYMSENTLYNLKTIS